MFDVAIIGYGPAGATLANLLGQAGLSVVVLEKEAGIYPLPRAIHFDGEVMRIFQSAGLRPKVEAISRPGLKGMHFVNAEGETLMIRGGTAAQGPHGCASNHYFHQPELEQVLRDGAARFASVQVRLRHEVTQITEAADHINLTVTDMQVGRASEVQARYVVGCDGARSMVRKVLGSPMTDLGLRQPWLVFDVILKDNAPALPDHTVQFCDPARPMTWCNVTGNRRRWEIMLMPGDDPAQLVQPTTLWQLVSRWMKPEHADIERAAIYTFHSLIAQGWRKGRLMLAGDSAHQTPPFLGQGMCAALRDVSNLAWKLEAVLQGHASESLLDTYESERSPHVHAFIELAVKLGDIIQATDADKARERDAKFRAGGPEIFEFPSPRLGPGLLHGNTGPVGQPFPQPVLDDGRLMDLHIGNRFAVIGRPALLGAVSEETKALWQHSNVVVMATQEPALLDWLDSHGVGAAMLRPDRYILGLAKTPGELDAITACLPVAELQPH
ncbi:3-(3-hydroxy-phenyl)propionate hydroxylase [Acidovorax sp. 69]|uniref:bifunctional 3-(3-hydroxy-phenyl)propionate/3-hydroxycinnamic acid hydroxylase MhpA n=1 Tax=Acidovorax sp. 69 TaxID=2035202 RepID=UPI000C236B8F|nr:bifunctional 3-(3-hydroxy-phenyl)propionate/3-hydroxycinnamic acid hydroxylase [Acidovorax sp. 69]PJI97722.1 3-(3-hydroxy-phenyl)propionate hydroxylase [Acidovorax sp. 69]